MPDLYTEIASNLEGGGGAPPASPPTDPGAGFGGGSPPAAPAAAPPPSPSPQDPSAGAIPQGGAPAAAAQATQQEMVSLIEAARQAGYQPPEGMSDYAFFTHLLGQAQAAQQLRHLQPLVQEYAQQRDQYAEWRRQQALAQQQQAQKQPEQWWKAPEFDPAWRHQVYRDGNGAWQVVPGTDPSVLQKFMGYQQWHQKTQDDFYRDPIGTLKPGLEQLVGSMLDQALSRTTQQFEDTQFTRNFLAANQHWLYEQQNGQPLRGPDGRPRLSHWGQRFNQHLTELQADGITGDQRLAQRAYALTDYEFALARLSQQQAPAQASAAGQQQKQAFLAQAGQGGLAAPPAQNGGPVPGAPGTPAPLPTMQSASDVARAIMQGFEAAGVTDRSIRESFRQGAA